MSPTVDRRLAVAGVSPAPTEAEAAAIMVAVEMLWPVPTVPMPEVEVSGWRFSARGWDRSARWPARQY